MGKGFTLASKTSGPRTWKRMGKKTTYGGMRRIGKKSCYGGQSAVHGPVGNTGVQAV